MRYEFTAEEQLFNDLTTLFIGRTHLAFGEVTFYSFKTSSVLLCKISSLQG